MKELIDLLIKHEGLRLKAYRCTAGKTTVGVGRNLDDVGITEDEAFMLLENDIARISDEANSSFPWFKRLDNVRKDVVLSMIFNLGLAGFGKFKRTISVIEAGEYGLAADYMLESKWATQVGRRAKELSEMMRTGKRAVNG